MCGVFGFIADKGRKVNLVRLAEVAKVTEKRGPHAFGFAWIDGRGRLRMYKQTGRISDHLGVLAMASDARMLIGHCRWATQGDPANNLNNHPHAADGGWIVHNGVIRNDSELAERHGLAPVTQCDSEVLGLMIERFDGTLAERCASAVAQIAPESPAVLLGLWPRSGGRLIAVRSGNPLHVGRGATGIYLASLREGLPRNAKAVKDGSTVEFRIDHEGNCHGKTIKSKRTGSRGGEGGSGADEEGDAAAACAGGRSQATLFDGADGGVCAVPVHDGAARPYAIKSRRTYGF